MNQEHSFLGNQTKEQIEDLMEQCRQGLGGNLPGAKSHSYLRWFLKQLEERHAELEEEDDGCEVG
jgi:hypothetical protein